MEIFFNSSMPRSGSTLLQNILGNHPEIYATPTSPLFEYLNSLRQSYTKGPTIKAQDSDEMKKAYLELCLYGMHGFFNGLTDKPYAIDKSRAWAVNYDLLSNIYPNPKIICMVRDLRDIVASMENNFRKHPDLLTAKSTVVERVNDWMAIDSKPVGHTLKNLKEVFHRGFNRNILFIRHEDLTKRPQKTMDIIQDFLQINRHNYDFTNIKQVTFENDKFHGIYGDHKIKPIVSPVKSRAKELLGEVIYNQIYEMYKWYFLAFNYTK